MTLLQQHQLTRPPSQLAPRTLQTNDTVTSLPSFAENVVMPQEVQSQFKCAISGFDSKSQRGLRTHMEHKHKDLKESHSPALALHQII